MIEEAYKLGYYAALEDIFEVFLQGKDLEDYIFISAETRETDAESAMWDDPRFMELYNAMS